MGRARLSPETTRRFRGLCDLYLDTPRGPEGVPPPGLCALCNAPWPGWLEYYGGLANLVSHVALIVCRVAMLFVDTRT